MRLFDTVPDSWDVVQITEISDINPTYPEDPPDDNELASFVPMKKVEEMTGKLDPSEHKKWEEINSGYTRFQEDDIVFAKITPSMENGKAALARNLKNGVAAGTTELHVIRPSERVLSKFILYFLLQEGFRREAEANMTGTAGHMRVPSEFMKNVEIPLPQISEQRRIVTKVEKLFSKLDSGVSDLEVSQKRLEQYRRSLLNAAITGKLSGRTREGEGNQSGQAIDQTNDLFTEVDFLEPNSDYPENWKVAALDQISDVETGATPLRGNDEYWGGEIPWVKSGAVNNDTIDSADEFITQKALEENNVTLFPPETLIVGMYGQGSTRGKISTLKFEATTNQACAGVIIPEELSFLRPWVKIYFEDHYHALRRKAAGGVQPNLNLGILRSMEIPLPPKSEVEFICDAVERQKSVIQQTDRTLSENIKRAKRLRQSILKHAFEGKLVRQNPNAEPPKPDVGDTKLEPGEQATLSEVITDVQ